MLIREYRIPFPCTIEEYYVGTEYLIARASIEEQTGGRNAVEVLKRESYYENDHQLPPGMYTEKVLHIREFLPRFLKFLIPERHSKLIEKVWITVSVAQLYQGMFADNDVRISVQSWNAYPERCLTTYESPWLGKSFHLSVESRYIGNDRGSTPNALDLTGDDLRNREVVHLDIASELLLSPTADTDVRDFESQVTKRPRLGSGGVWIRQHSPIMCAYKVVKIDVSSAVLPGHRVEQWAQRHGLQSNFLHYNRLLLRWIDSWFSLQRRDVLMFAAPPTLSGAAPKCQAVGAVKTVLSTELSAEAAAERVFAYADATNPFS